MRWLSASTATILGLERRTFVDSTVTFADHHVCHGQAARLVLDGKLQADVVMKDRAMTFKER